MLKSPVSSDKNVLEGKKVYFPVESLVGLGHFNRTGKLVRAMVGEGMGVTVASGTFVDPERFFAGAQHEDIPTYVFKNKAGKCYTLAADGQRTALPDFNLAAHEDTRIAAHQANIAALAPDITISEFWPFDRPQLDREMEAVLQASKAACKDNRAIVSVRDVMDAMPDMTAEDRRDMEERQEKSVNTINEHFDAVLVHGDPQFVRLSDTFAAAADIKVPVIYTGYVVGTLPHWQISYSEKRPFLVSCGSGVDGHEMIYAFLTSWEKLLEKRDIDNQVAEVVNRPLHIICGPRFAPKAYEYVQDWAQELAEKYGQDIRVEEYRKDYTSLMANSAFSVSLAGYNTTLETLAVGVPALLIPKYAVARGKMRWSTEQLYRLERLQQQGLARYGHPEDVQNSTSFAEIIVDEFMNQREGLGHYRKKPRPNLAFMGAQTTTGIIEDLIKDKRYMRDSVQYMAAQPLEI